MAAICSLAGNGADGTETSPQQDSSNEQQQDTADQPGAHCELPAGSVVTFAVFAQSAEHLALVAHWVRCLTCHTQEIRCLGEEVGEVCARVTDGDAFFVHEALAFVARQDAVPVWIVHDAVEGVHAAGDRRPADSGRGGGDVVDRDSHVAGSRLPLEQSCLCLLLFLFQNEKLNCSFEMI